MILVEVKVPSCGTKLPDERNELQRLASHKNDAGGQQSGEELSHHQHIAADWRKKIEMQTLIEDLAAKQIHEDSQTAEEDREAQIEKLEHAGKNRGTLGSVISLADLNARDFVIRKLDIKVVESVGVVILVVRNHLHGA